MALEKEDVDQIGQMIAMAFKDNVDVIRQAVAPADPPPNDPPADPPPNSSESPAPFTLEAMAEAFTKKLEERDATKNEDVMNVLFKEKLDNAMASTPGLQEYLESDDDYGAKRLDQISTGTYEEKLSKLNSVSQGYAEAVAGEGGRPPVVSEKVQKRAQETAEKYEALDEKMKKGEYNSVNDMAEDFFNTLEVELAGVA